MGRFIYSLFPSFMALYILVGRDAVGGSSVFMDHFGHCSKHEGVSSGGKPYNYFPVATESTLLAKGTMGSSSFVAMTCTVTFKAKNEKVLCAKFQDYKITNCGINVKVFDKSTASGKYRAKFSCHQTPHDICSSGAYLTIQLNKPSVHRFLGEYNFEVLITEASQADVMNTSIFSLGVIIGIVAGGVIVIVLVVVAIKCLCLDKRKRKDKGKNYQPTGSSATEPPVQPSAPPPDGYESHPMTASFHGNYPQGVIEPPPPYTET